MKISERIALSWALIDWRNLLRSRYGVKGEEYAKLLERHTNDYEQ